MSIKLEYFSIEVSAKLGNIEFHFFFSENNCVYGKKSVSLPHHHGKNYELRYISAGTGGQNVEGEHVGTKAGDLLLIHPEECHFQTDEDTSEDLKQYGLRFFIKPPSKSAPEAHKKEYASIVELFDSIRVLSDEEMKLLPFWKILSYEIKNRKPGYLNYIQSTCVIIMTEIIRLAPNQSARVLQPDDPKKSLYLQDQIAAFFSRHYMEDMKLTDLANAINVSTRQASRILLREFGMNYITKLTEVRLQQVKYQLTHTDKNIHQISIDCGFPSYSYFSTCFRKNVGMTPSQYRNSASRSKLPE